MLKPKYTITNKLLANIKRVNSQVLALNSRHFPKVVLMDFERQARLLSTFTSTSIEGNPLPLTEVKKILKSTPKYIRETEREVLNYNKALKRLNQRLEKRKKSALTTGLILNVHKQIIKELLPDFQAGKWRKETVQILNPKIQRPVFLPPDWQEVPALINDLVMFINKNKEEIDPLILAGIFHKQFVLIHPFIDGNGRTSRLITKTLLADMGLNTFNLFSFENYYNQDVTKYFSKVGEYGDYNELVKQNKIDFSEWLEYFTDGIINELLRVEKLLFQTKQTPEDQLKQHHQIILNWLQFHSFITDKDYSKLTNRAKATRALDFKFLIKQNLIKREAKGKNTYYILKESSMAEPLSA
ncbi:Fic family protein [Patescibacteria group bacterium]|nr:Fic family protein [Patescibacteria group bacterium]